MPYEGFHPILTNTSTTLAWFQVKSHHLFIVNLLLILFIYKLYLTLLHKLCFTNSTVD